MRSKICAKATVIAILAMLTIGVSPLALAQGGDAEATAGNVAPIVTSVTAPDVVPLAAADFSCTVQDNNTLADIENVVLKVYLDTVGENAPDNIVNHYTFKYDGTTWSEIGPDLAGSHISDGTEPENLANQSGVYVFKITLAGVAAPGTDLWTAKWIATDDNDAEGSSTDAFSVDEYIALTIDTDALAFSGEPGDENLPSNPANIVCTVTSNYTFDIQVSLSDNWSGPSGGVIPMSNTKAAQDNSHTGDLILSGTPEDIWSAEALGENIERSIFWFLDLPVPLPDGTYTTTFQVQAVKTT